MQDWHRELTNISRARTYRYITLAFGFELYLNISARKFLVALAQLRTSAHRLAVETGRWANIPYGERTCRSSRG